MTLPKSIPVAPTAASLAGKAEAKAESRAWRDAMKHIARDIPDPDVYARMLPLDLAEMLLAAQFRNSAYFVPFQQVHILRSLGLVECGEGKRCLTAFAIKVRRALKEQDA